ncbi:MAG: hypothetical protein KGI08_02560 [Thaumarchaeota archaeon]|nr:hypothetical protein [Nitrososphaerota archaeon]
MQKDIPACIELGKEFAYLSQPIHRFSVSENRIRLFANEVINDPNCVVVVSENDGKVDGVLAGGIVSIFFSEDIALQELVWYVKKNVKGMPMLDLFETQGKNLGANRIIVGNKPQYYDLKRLYERRGYSLLENHFVKVV